MRCSIAIVVAVLACGAAACGDDGGGDMPDAGAPDPLADTWGALNLDCPQAAPPFEGEGGKRGPCCYRSAPNSLRVDELGDSDASVIEYRFNYMVQVNHPYSLSLMALKSLAITRADNEEQSLVMRLTGPRKNGELAAGPGSITVGQGRYNCDGTYSFYSDKAAPMRKDFPGADDPGRWQKRVVPMTIDPTKEGRETATIAFEDNYAGRSYSPFVSSENFELAWEAVTQSFDIVELNVERDGLDCQGSRQGTTWLPAASFEVYATLEDNHHFSNGIPDLRGQTLGQLLAFGLIANPDDLDKLDPLGERCTPEPENQDSQCRWVELPSALCPVTDDERGLFRCHPGWPDNPYGEVANCTMTAPESARDDPEGDEGQCCDPYGDEASGLPACNAYRLHTEIVAAAAEITDEDGPIVKDCR